MIEIKTYQRTDLEEIVQLFYQTVHFVNIQDYTKEQVDTWANGSVDLEKWHRSFLEYTTYVAKIEGKIVGFGDITKEGYLDFLYVHYRYLHLGIATKLCDALEKAVSTSLIETHASITAKPFFEKRGYKVIKQQQVLRQGVLLTNYVMIKQIIK